MRGAATLAALLLAAAGIARAQEVPGVAEPDRTVRDPEFGVVARHLGLERRVEMLQWQATGQGYARVWSEQPIDSSAFAPGHANPPFPLQGQRWLPASVSIDGKPLAPAVLAQLGEWRDFRPSFSALPGNLAATFQPEGDGLGSADNPLAPQVGDLRIHWRELVLPPLDDRIVLREGHWQLSPEPPDPSEVRRPASGQRPLWWGGGAIVVLIAALAARRRRHKS